MLSQQYLDGEPPTGDATRAADDSDIEDAQRLVCAKCDYTSTSKQLLLLHARDLHRDSGVHVCPQCPYATRNRQKLEAHVTTTHDNDEREEEACIELEETEEMEEDNTETSCVDETTLQCPQCDFSAVSSAELLDHERVEHADSAPDRHYFSCNKCNYVTHIKSRFTKHVKYHSMPMIKCTICDFRTPYKWNLDRHMKNHGGTGGFCCCTCNFTADIKQSLTVHEMNHHTPPVGTHSASTGGRRRRVGASDLARAAAAAEDLVTRDDVSADSDVGSNVGNTMYAPHQADKSEIVTMEVEETGEHETAMDGEQSFQNVCSALESLRQSRKPRPIPQLIPLNCSTPHTSTKTSPTEPPLKRFKDMFSGNIDLDILNYSSTDIFKADRLPEDLSTSSANSPTSSVTALPRKKNASFFDKLKERLMTESSANGTLTCKNCAFESKCLSEHSVHEKNCTSHTKNVIQNSPHTSVSSTRCQNCRHRCKSSADLYVHMQTCKTKAIGEKKSEQPNRSVAPAPQESDQPHPMENVVFVWNPMSIENKTKPVTESLNISINDDSMGPSAVEVLTDTESETLSPHQPGKKVFKCPHCPFWASTASRFHVHIVGHLNKKPFECSICNYKSNWRWDITKHIRLKTVRDPDHNNAKVLMTDETGRRNYTKYNQYLVALTEDQLSRTFGSIRKAQDAYKQTDTEDPEMVSLNSESMPLDLHTSNRHGEVNPPIKKKKTLWKCKKCNYKNPSKEALLDHVREHTKSLGTETDDGASASNQHQNKQHPTKEPDSPVVAYQCGHCNQLSNWKHVIQRHCRLKHNGEIKVVPVDRPKIEPVTITEVTTDSCNKCPFKTNDKSLLFTHMSQHYPSPLSIFKCYFCPYFVKTENDLMEHLALHGVTNPEEYVSKAMGCRDPLPDQPVQVKRHKCTDCPYETNSRSQYMYHEQFHRLPANTPYKCQVCNYSVTKRHLLHQHMKVHGVSLKKESADLEPHTEDAPIQDISTAHSATVKIETDAGEIPFVWVSAKNEFHKMYKCRYCSYVNAQLCKIPNHEKIHIVWYDNDMRIYKCLECKFTCDTPFRLSEHSNTHGEIYGRIYCAVDPNLSDEDQIAKLRKLLEEEKNSLLEASLKRELADEKDVEDDKSGDIKYLYYCKKCPSRLFNETELKIHKKFHELRFSISCKFCSFTVPSEGQMISHEHVHTDEYQSKTKMLQMMHETHPNYPQPNLKINKLETSDEPFWVAVPGETRETNTTQKTPRVSQKTYSCRQCPAKFFKSSALSYHTNLHGGPGSHTCKKCNYTVNNVGNLAKHELVHESDGAELTNGDAKHDVDSGDDIDFKNVPLSGTDLFHRKTEAQKRQNSGKVIAKPNDHFPPVLQADPQFGYLMHGNPEFIYPTYLKNGRQKEKRYKCHKCPSAFEKREQYKVHLSLHGSKQRYKCELCDYSVKYYANYTQHMRKHQMNAEAHAERKKAIDPDYDKRPPSNEDDDDGNIKLAIKSIPKYTTKSTFQQFSIEDQQTLRLLQRRRSSVGSSKEPGAAEPILEKEGRKLHSCPLCPYTNQRKDSLENHMKKHKRVSGIQGNHECSHCDFSCNQSHFLREHLKTHFNYHKNTEPKCFTHSEGVILTITRLDDEDAPFEMDFSVEQNIEESAKAEKIFIQPSTGEIIA